VSMSMLFTTLGMEMDSGRLVVTRHKNQVIADACALAAAQELPCQSKADTAITKMVGQYQKTYNKQFRASYQYIASRAPGQPTRVRVTIDEDVPMFVPALMGFATRPTQGVA